MGVYESVVHIFTFMTIKDQTRYIMNENASENLYYIPAL